MIRVLCLNPTIDRMYHINNFEAGTKFTGNTPSCYPAGKGINVAKILSSFSERCVVYAFTGGRNGRLIEDEVARLGHEGVFFHHDGETRMTVNIIDRVQNQETEITEAGIRISARQQEDFLGRLEQDTSEGDLVICSGSPANGMDQDIYRKVSLICEKKGARCALDANKQYLKGAFPGNYIFAKPNRNELQTLFHMDSALSEDQMVAKGRQLVQSGVTNLLISLGEEGAVFVNEQFVYRLRVPRVSVVSTIGSGDATVTGFCLGLVKGLSLEDCLKQAMAFGVVNAMYPEAGHLEANDVKRILPLIQLTRN